MLYRLCWPEDKGFVQDVGNQVQVPVDTFYEHFTIRRTYNFSFGVTEDPFRT